MKSILHYFFYLLNYIVLKGNKVEFKKFKIFGMIIIRNKGKMTMGDHIKINSNRYTNVIGGDTRTSFVVKKDALMLIGNNVRISNSAFYCQTEIIIEDNVMIGGSCKIWDSDFHPIDPAIRRLTPNEHYSTRSIHIKESAFIGSCSLILKGVTIGKNAVIGAGSIVSRSIPDNEIWAGNPAKFIKMVGNGD